VCLCRSCQWCIHVCLCSAVDNAWSHCQLLLPEAAHANYRSSTSTIVAVTRAQSTGTRVTRLDVHSPVELRAGWSGTCPIEMLPPARECPSLWCYPSRYHHKGSRNSRRDVGVYVRHALYRTCLITCWRPPVSAPPCGTTREYVSQVVQELKTGRWCVVQHCIAYRSSAPQSKFKTVCP
jgi:hypothetical protein